MVTLGPWIALKSYFGGAVGSSTMLADGAGLASHPVETMLASLMSWAFYLLMQYFFVHLNTKKARMIKEMTSNVVSMSSVLMPWLATFTRPMLTCSSLFSALSCLEPFDPISGIDVELGVCTASKCMNG